MSQLALALAIGCCRLFLGFWVVELVRSSGPVYIWQGWISLLRNIGSPAIQRVGRWMLLTSSCLSQLVLLPVFDATGYNMDYVIVGRYTDCRDVRLSFLSLLSTRHLWNALSGVASTSATANPTMCGCCIRWPSCIPLGRVLRPLMNSQLPSTAECVCLWSRPR